MHSNRMRTARLLTVSRSIRSGGCLPGGGLPGDVCSGRGCLPRGLRGVCLGAWGCLQREEGCLPRGVSA